MNFWQESCSGVAIIGRKQSWPSFIHFNIQLVNYPPVFAQKVFFNTKKFLIFN